MSEVKTLAVRLDPDLHSRLTILSKLNGVSITDVIRSAIEKEVQQLATNPGVAAKAHEYQDAIARDAEQQQAAIQALFGDKPTSTRTARQGTPKQQ